MKNGFTLIELIAIIVTLSVIALVSFPAVINMQQNSKEQEKQSALKNLYISTESYILSDYKDEYDNSNFQIYIVDLIESGYVKSDSINPNTNVKYVLSDYVDVTRKENNEFSFELKKAKICKRAEVSTLHQETCNYSSTTEYCIGAGYSLGDTITYGNKTVTTNKLKSGDAFDCDVNGDRIYDPVTERFYYVSGINGDNNSEYAVLIYYNNTTSGVPDSSVASLIAYDTSGENWHGPRTGIANLPTINQWANVSLSSVNRAILNQDGGNTTTGGTLPSSFSYTNSLGVEYAARLITTQELGKACGGDEFPNEEGEMDNCQFLMENTTFADNSSGTDGYWTETPYSSYSNAIMRITTSKRYLSLWYPEDPTRGIRPVIEVLKTDILY